MLDPVFAAVFTLGPSGFFALAWPERLARVRRHGRAWVRFLLDRDVHARMAARRRALLAEMRELAALLGESPPSAVGAAQVEQAALGVEGQAPAPEEGVAQDAVHAGPRVVEDDGHVA